MATPQLFAALYSTTKEMEGKIQATHQFIINSHKPLEALQEVLKSHQSALVTLAASVGFYRNITLGSFVVTVITGLTAARSNREKARLLTLIAIAAGVTFLVSLIMWMVKHSNYTNQDYMTTCYTQLIDVKKLTQG